MVTIKIRHIFLTLLISLSALSAKAQESADFEKFAQDFFILLSDTAEYPNLEYIRIKTWRELIAQQNLSDSEKQELEIRKNKEYTKERATFENKLGFLVQSFYEMVDKGGKLSLTFSDYQPHAKWNNAYHCSLKIYYESEGVQSIVNLEYDLYYNGRGLMFIGDKLEAEY